MRPSIVIAAAAVVALGGCATMPTGPSVAVMPADGKPLAQFQQEDGSCRNYAAQLTGGRSPAQAANGSGSNGASPDGNRIPASAGARSA